MYFVGKYTTRWWLDIEQEKLLARFSPSLILSQDNNICS